MPLRGCAVTLQLVTSAKLPTAAAPRRCTCKWYGNNDGRMIKPSQCGYPRRTYRVGLEGPAMCIWPREPEEARRCSPRMLQTAWVKATAMLSTDWTRPLHAAPRRAGLHALGAPSVTQVCSPGCSHVPACTQQHSRLTRHGNHPGTGTAPKSSTPSLCNASCSLAAMAK